MSAAPMILAVGAHKGGVGKTTSAVLLALALHALGRRVAVIDADPQASARTWRARAGASWPAGLDVVSWEARDSVDWAHDLVIDTPPGHPARLAAAVTMATHVLIPVGSRRGDVAQLASTLGTVADAAGHDPTVAVLLTMRRGSTRAAREAAETIERDGIPLLATEVPLSAAIADAFGAVPARVPGAYRDVLGELAPELTGEVVVRG